MKNYKFKINGTDYNVDINEVVGEEISLTVNGKKYTAILEKKESEVKAPIATPRVSNRAANTPVQVSSKPQASKGNAITTPLPGVILDVKVNVGDQVKEGQCIAILEAMKMENSIEAEMDGTIKEVKVRQGDSVLEGDVLVVIE